MTEKFETSQFPSERRPLDETTAQEDFSREFNSMKEKVTRFDNQIKDAFTIMDLNGDNEVTKKEVAAVQAQKWSPLKPDFVALVSDNFDLIANLQRQSWNADETISSDDIRTISDIYRSETECAMFTEEAKSSLIRHSNIMENGNYPIADQKWMIQNFYYNRNTNSEMREFLVDNYEGIAGLDRSTIQEKVLFTSVISPDDVPLMTAQAIVAGQTRAMYQAHRAFGNDFEQKRQELDKFMNTTEAIFKRQE